MIMKSASVQVYRIGGSESLVRLVESGMFDSIVSWLLMCTLLHVAVDEHIAFVIRPVC